VPQAGSQTSSPSFGSTSVTISWMICASVVRKLAVLSRALDLGQQILVEVALHVLEGLSRFLSLPAQAQRTVVRS